MQGTTSDEEDAAIVAAVVSLAHSVGRRRWPRGWRPRTRSEPLIAAGCDQAQGFHFGVPQTTEAIERVAALGNGLTLAGARRTSMNPRGSGGPPGRDHGDDGEGRDVRGRRSDLLHDDTAARASANAVGS